VVSGAKNTTSGGHGKFGVLLFKVNLGMTDKEKAEAYEN
jgi:hypothetical protein